jgi:hypothetical protein
MSILPKLASALGRRDEVPNQVLAKSIATQKDRHAVEELVANLSNRKKDIQSDCIKVLYEIGAIKPSLISEYVNEFIALLEHKNNRLQWGAMTALSSIVAEDPKALFNALPRILKAAEKGSVITKDHAMNILIKLCSQKQYTEKSFTLLIEQLKKSLTNQLPMYAENAMSVVNEKNRTTFIETLNSRLDDIEKDSKRKRVEKVIKKLSAK